MNISSHRTRKHHGARRPWATIALLALALLPGMAAAQGAAIVDPASAVHVASAGGVVEASFRIMNPTANALTVRLYLSDWGFNPVGDFTFADPGTQPSSASDWVVFDPPTAVVPPNSGIDVAYTVAVPPDAEPGSHWSVLFVETEPSAPEPGQPTATFSVRVGHIVYVNVGQGESSGAILGIFGEPPVAATDPYRLYVQYANTGNVVQGLEGRLSLRDRTGAVVLESDLERQVVLPGSERAVRVNLYGPLPAGDYTALVVLDYGDADVEVAGAYDLALEIDLEDPRTP